MVYEKVSPDMKFVEREKEVEKFWADEEKDCVHVMEM